jgi:hypothetical protein
MFRPRWRRRRSPELAGEARRRRRRTGVASEIEERRGAEAGLGRFDQPRSWPVGLDPAGLAGLGQWAKAHLQIQFNWEKFEILFFFLKINSNLRLNQFCLI